MSTERLDIVTPVGRLVGGSVHTKFEKDMQGKPKTTPNYFFAVAFEKTNTDFQQILQQLYSLAYNSYANNPDVLNRIQMSYQQGFSDLFAWKVDDGDDLKFKDRTGYPGHWVLKFSTTLNFYCVSEMNAHIDPKTIELGYYVDVAFNAVINGNKDHTAGIYINPQCVRLIAYGEKIVTGPSPMQLMGNAPQAALPAGASRTPLAGSAQPAPGMTQPAPGMTQPAPSMTQPAPSMTQPAPGMTQPAPGMTQPAPAPGMAGVQQPAPAVDMTAPANVGAQTQTSIQTGTVSLGNIQPDHNFVNAPGLPPMPGQTT